jgi:predicted RNA-binding protein with PUA-like domain
MRRTGEKQEGGKDEAGTNEGVFHGILVGVDRSRAAAAGRVKEGPQVSGRQSLSSPEWAPFLFAGGAFILPSFAPVTKATNIVGHWLVKQEPESYSWEDFVRDGRTSWDGVRNYQARNNLRGMRAGDPVLFYSSGESKAVVGIAKVSKAAYPDPTGDDPAWVSVEIQAVKALKRPVTLAEIRADAALAGVILVRHTRLSVMPLAAAEYDRIVRLGG